jgi:hypothetical protein
MKLAVLVATPWIGVDAKWNSSMYTPGVRGAIIGQEVKGWMAGAQDGLSRFQPLIFLGLRWYSKCGCRESAEDGHFVHGWELTPVLRLDENLSRSNKWL